MVKIRRILFLCTGNCVRSQMAEVLMNWRGQPRIQAVSAGSHPAGFVHEMTYQAIQELGICPGKLVSKSWEKFKDQQFDAVITLCANARDEVCPLWPAPPEGTLPVRAHWGFDDPTSYWLLSETDLLQEFRRVRDEIRESIERLATAPDDVLQDDPSFIALVNHIAADAPNPEE